MLIKINYFSGWHILKDMKWSLCDSLKYFILGLSLWRAAAVITVKKERKHTTFQNFGVNKVFFKEIIKLIKSDKKFVTKDYDFK